MKYLKGVSTLKYDSENCTGCGRCTEVCPHGVFVKNNGTVSVTDADLCMECGACKMNCAFGAISVEAGVGCAEAIINSILRGGEPTCGCSGGEPGTGGTGCC